MRSQYFYYQFVIYSNMKLFFSLLIAGILVSTSSVFGQFSFGGKIGGATTNLSGVGLKDFVPDAKVKLIGGGIINYSFGKIVALQAEVLYSGKGSAFSYYYEDQTRRGKVTIDQKLGYLAVPLMLQFKLGDRSNYFHFDIGVVSNNLVYDKFTGSIDAENDQGDVIHENDAFSLDASPQNFDLGYTFGIGLVANGLNFDFHYEKGTKQVFNFEDETTILNQSFQVSVGYTIGY